MPGNRVFILEQVAAEDEEEEGFLQTEEFYVRPKSTTNDTKNYNRDQNKITETKSSNRDQRI